MRYELGYYMPGDGILHSHRLENLKSYIALTGWLCSGDAMLVPDVKTSDLTVLKLIHHLETR
jgi:hypothetical protein